MDGRYGHQLPNLQFDSLFLGPEQGRKANRFFVRSVPAVAFMPMHTLSRIFYLAVDKRPITNDCIFRVTRVEYNRSPSERSVSFKVSSI